MASSLCLFCQHSNRARAVAKFCNNCGNPLHLKPCSQCGAINDRAIRNCYRCGAGLPVTRATTGPAPASSSAEAAASTSSSRARRVEALRESAAETGTAFTARQAVDKAAGVEPADNNMERVKEAVELGKQEPDAGGVGFGRNTRLGSALEGTRPGVPANTPVGTVAREVRPLVGHLTVRPSASQGATQMVPLPKLAPAAAEHRRSHPALIAIFIVVVAVSAYYVNRNPAQLNFWFGVSEPDPGVLVTADPIRPPSFAPPAKIGVAPSSSPALGFGTASVENAGSTATEASAESTSKVTAAPGDGADTPAAKPHGVNDDALPRPSASRTDPAKPISAIAAETADDTKRPAASRVDAARQPSAELTTRSSAAAAALLGQRATESRGGAAPDAPRVVVCTEAVAALGLCNLNDQGENK